MPTAPCPTCNRLASPVRLIRSSGWLRKNYWVEEFNATYECPCGTVFGGDKYLSPAYYAQ